MKKYKGIIIALLAVILTLSAAFFTGNPKNDTAKNTVKTADLTGKNENVQKTETEKLSPNGATQPIIPIRQRFSGAIF